MNKKEAYIIILLFIFTSFLLFTHPAYTGFITQDQCGVDINTCQDYPNETECNTDTCLLNCYYDGTECLEYTQTCDDIEDETDCVTSTLNCEWFETCIEYGQTPEPPTTSTQDKITTIQNLQADPDKMEIIQTLNIDLTTPISGLNSYSLQIQTAEQDTTLSEAEIQTIIADLQTQIDTLLIDTPKLIVIESQITNLPATPVEDITADMLPADIQATPEEVYYIQDKLQARTDLKKFSLLTFSDTGFTGTYVKKTITTQLQSGYILEIIPLITEEELNFLGTYQTIKQEPLTIAIPFSNSAALYSYVIMQDISQQIQEIQTAIAPYETGVEPTIEIICGDGICTEYLEDENTCPEDCARKIPWTLIITIFIIIIAIILFLHFFKNKLGLSKFKNIFKKKPKSLFTSETDKENLKNYIKHALDEGISQEKIKAVLMTKGWSKEQVDLIINEIKQPEEKPEEYRETTPLPPKEEPPKEEESTGSDLEI